MNLRLYYPDFVAIDSKDTHCLLETEGAETGDVAHKDTVATQWCLNATQLTRKKWEYLKVPQKGFEALQATHFEHLRAFAATGLF
jgi:hypothetical protein